MTFSILCVRCGKTFPHIDYKSGPLGAHVIKIQPAGCIYCQSDYKKQFESERCQREKLDKKVSFLGIRDFDPSNELFSGNVVLLIDGSKRIETRRLILASRSPVFCKMFQHDMKEKLTGNVTVDDATLPVMQAVVHYCYTSDIAFTDEVDPAEVLRIAHRYQISLLIEDCVEELCKRIDHQSLPQLVVICKKYGAFPLREKVNDYLKEHFDELFWKVVEECDSAHVEIEASTLPSTFLASCFNAFRTVVMTVIDCCSHDPDIESKP